MKIIVDNNSLLIRVRIKRKTIKVKIKIKIINNKINKEKCRIKRGLWDSSISKRRGVRL
jgi:hypothetical protein